MQQKETKARAKPAGKTIKASTSAKKAKPAAKTPKTAAKAAKPAAKTPRAEAKTVKPAAKTPKAAVKTAKPAAKTSKTAAKTKKAPVLKGKNAGLIKELNDLLPQLDEECLTSLIDQAQAHIYNVHIDEVNKFMITTGENEYEHSSGDFSLKVSADRYYISYRNESIMFNQTEMVQIAKYAMAPIPLEERKTALHRWLDEERRDVLGILTPPNSRSDVLDEFITMLNRTLTLKYR